MDDITIWPTMQELLACLTATLEEGEASVEQSSIEFGHESAFDWDEHDGCGSYAWVRLDTGFPSLAFPTPDEGPSAHPGAQLGYVLEVGVARTFDDNEGDPLTPAQRTELARRQIADMSLMRKAICACLAPAGITFMLGQYTTLNLGGIVDGRWPVTVLWERDA